MYNLIKKTFTFSVVATTMIWSVGVAALIPSVAQGATCPTLAAGDMIKVVGKPAIYAVNNDLKVLYFPSGDEFKSWRPTYGGYISIDQACFDSLSVPSTYPGGVNYHPGSYLIKRPSSDQLYVVEPNNTKAKITVEAATTLYSTGTYSDGVGYKVMTVADPFWPHYVNTGADISTATVHPGMLFKVSGQNTTWYVDENNKLREVTDTGFTANQFQQRFVRTVAASAISGLATGDKIEAEVAALVDKTQGGGVTSGGTTIVGTLAASLSADTPASKSLAKGSAYNDVLHVTLTAGSNAVTVTGVTVQKTGLLARTDMTGVAVYDESGVRHGSIATALDDSGYVTIGFGNDPITVPANGSKKIAIKVNISSSATATNFYMGMTAVESNGSISGLPVVGNQMSVVAGTLASYTISAGSVSGSATEALAAAGDGQFEIGDVQKEVGKFSFAEAGNEDLKFESITFFISGTVADETNLANWTVYGPSNEVLGTTAASDGRYVTVPVSYTLQKGYTKSLTVKVDIVDGSQKDFQIQIQNDYDVMAKGLTTGYYVLPGSFSAVEPTNGWFKIQQGNLSVQKAAASPSSNIPAGSSDVVLGQFDLKALGEDIEIRKMALEIEAAEPSDPDLTGNIKVQSADGLTTYLSRTYSDFIASTTLSDSAFATGTQWDLSTYLTISSLQTKSIRIIATVADGATASDTYMVKVGKFYIKRLSTLDYQTKPSATVAYPANTLTVQAAAITVANNTSVGNNYLPASAQDVVLGSFKLQAGSSEDINVTQALILFTTSTYIQNVGLWNGSTQLGNEVVTPVTTSNTYSFSLTVHKNEVLTIDIKGDITSSAASPEYHQAKVASITAVGASTGENAFTAGVVSLQTMYYNNTMLVITNDSSVESKILMPGATKQLVGIHKYEAKYGDITLKKITFAVRDDDNSAEGTAADYGDIELRDASGNVLASAPVIDSGSTSLVTFTGFEYLIPSGTSKKLYLYAGVNGSGVMTPASINTLAVYSDSNTNLEAYANTGLLSTTYIGSSTAASGAETYFSATNPLLFHNQAPTIAKHSSSPSGAQTPGSETELFRYTVTNPGTRDIRIVTTTAYVSASGMAGLGSVATWKLYDGSTLLATNSTVTINSSSATSTVTFDLTNDESSRLANFILSAGETKTFKVTANTSNIRTGVSSGSYVYFTVNLDGATGYDTSADTNEDNWADGVIFYHYTPVNGSENSDPYTASDSYDVNGNTLTF